MNKMNEAWDCLKELLRFNSVEGEPTDNAPFGTGVRKCLDFALEKMASYNFKVKDGDGYYGYGEIGEGELFGVLTHLDVVPVGDNWTHDPFGAEEVDGRLYGRGALDDKGPYCAAFFAAVRLLSEGYKPKKKLRFILGCDEESGWKCMDRYCEEEELPKVGFSPDGDFPVINCEKGIVYHTIRLPIKGKIISVFGGERANMVPNRAEAVVENDGEVIAYLNKSGIEYTVQSDGVHIVTEGTAAHGSHPENGDNAIIKLLKLLSGLDDGMKKMYLAFSDYRGTGVNLNISDDKSGFLTLNLGCVHTEGDYAVFELDIRHPVTYTKDFVTEKLQSSLPFSIEQGFYHLPLFVDRDNPLVKTLLDCYNEVTGEDASPIAIGGGTYARVLPLGVAFGPCFPGGNSGMHCADEYMDRADFDKMSEIYYLALKKLCF